MEKNQNNDHKKSPLRAVAHELEQSEVLYATEYQSPPILFETAQLEGNRKTSVKQIDQEEQPQNDRQIEQPVQERTDVASDISPLQQSNTEKEEIEEEPKESQSVELIFADEPTEPPSDGNDDQSSAGSSSGGDDDSNDDDAIQRQSNKDQQITGTNSNNILPEEVMSKMEQSFGADFSNVEINTNSQSAVDAGALAYTQGDKIEFAPGQFNPNSKSGQELIGHELAHVVQQRKGQVQPTKSVNGMPVNDDDALEKEADQLGALAASNDKKVTPHDVIDPKTLGKPIVQKKEPDKKDDSTFPVKEVEVALPMDNDQKVKVLLDPMTGGEFSYTAAKFPPGANPNLMNKPKHGGWSKKMQPITIPYGPGGIVATAEIGASLEAGLKGSFGIGEALIIPFVDPGRKATISGSANLTAKVEGELGLGVYGGLSIAHIAAQAYLNVTGSIGGSIGLSGTALWNPEGDLLSGQITLDTTMFAKAEASGGVKLTYYTPIADGTFAKFELTKATLGIIEFPIKAGVDLVTGKQVGSCTPKMEHISISFPPPTKVETISREEFEQRHGGVSQGGSGAPGYSYDEHAKSQGYKPYSGGGGSGGAGGASQYKENSSSSVIQKTEDEPVVDKTKVNIKPKDNTYDVSGTYQQIYKLFDGKMDAGRMAPVPTNVKTTGFSKDEKKCYISLDVILTKTLPKWKEFPEIKKKAQDKSNKYQAYFKKVVTQWEKFIPSVDKHEKHHLAIDKAHYSALPEFLKGVKESEVGSKIEEYGNKAATEHDGFHKDKEKSEIYKLKYLQKEPEKVKSQSAFDENSGEYDTLNTSQLKQVKNTNLFKRVAQFSGGSESSIRKSIVSLAQGEIGKVQSKIDDGSGNKKGYERLLEYFHTSAPGVWPDHVIKSVKFQGPSFGADQVDKDGAPTSGDQGGAKFPHWCGIFAIWAVKTAGMDVGNWEPGRGVLDQGKLGTTTSPKPGDIGYINKPKQHHSVIKEVNGDTIISIDGNMEFGEVREVTRPKGKYSGFFTAFGGEAIQKKEKAETSHEDQAKIMPGNVMQKMEESFGTSFSDVNIHKDSSKASDAGALAYAQGTDVHFAPGQFKPDTRRGQELIGHELAHVVQQKQGRVNPTSRQGGMAVNDDPGLEKEADDLGRKAASGTSSIAIPSVQKKSSNTAQFEKPKNVAPQTFVFDPYKYGDNLITRDIIQKFLDTFVNERGESLIIQFSMSASGYAQIGWLPAYIEVGLSTSFAYEKMQDFTYLLSANIDLSGKFGVGKASKKGGGAVGIAANAGYSYQWEYGGSKAVAGSIYNHLVNICNKLKKDDKLTEEQKQKLLIPLEGTDFVEAGAKKEIEVTTLGGGGFAQGEAKLGENKGGSASVEAMWSSSKVTHKDKQDGDKKDRTSLESTFSVNGNVSFETPWLGGTNIEVPASFSTTSVVGDPNVNMNGKYQDFVIQPTLLVQAKQVQELLDTWSTKSGPFLSKACKIASKMPGFGDINTAALASAVQIVIESIPLAGGQIKKYLPDKFFENKKSKLKIAPKVAFKWRQQESSGKRSYELMKWSLALELGKVYGSENSEDAKADMEASITGSTTIRLTGGIGTNTLYFIRQTYIDAPANKSNKKPEWDKFKSSNKENIALAIYNVVYNNGKGPSRNSSAGKTAEWTGLFNQIKSAKEDKKQFCIDNAESLIRTLENCFDKDDQIIKDAEVDVRDFVDLLSRIKSQFITSSKTLDQVIIALKVQYKKGGKSGVKSFLELSTSYGIDPVEVIQILGPYWGESAKSWFNKWGIPYRNYEQRPTEPKLAQYERLANILQVRIYGNDSVISALIQNATFGYEGEINDGNDGKGIKEIFQYAQNDSEFKEELKLDSVKTILLQDNFKYEMNPVLVLIHFLEKKINFKSLLRSWEKTGNWNMAMYRMDVIKIIGRAGYDFGIKVYGGEKENHKYFTYVGQYESMAKRARSILIKGYSWWTGYERSEQMFFYNLIADARNDGFLLESLKKYKVSYPHTETNPLRWLWGKITLGVLQKNLNYMLDHPPYFTLSNKDELREAGIDYTKGANGIIQKSEQQISNNDSPNGSKASIPSDVKVNESSHEASQMGASAFARGNEIHFAPGQFKPNTRSGQELIGHELGHVVQQKNSSVKPTTYTNGSPVNNEPGLEKEADDFGKAYADSLQLKSQESTESVNGGFSLSNSSVIQQKTENEGKSSDVSNVENVIENEKGFTLPSHLTSQASKAMNHDFSESKMYTGSVAQKTSKEMGVKAMAYGKDIIADDTSDHVLMHEMVHLKQQNNAKPSVQAKLVTGSQGGAAEKEADQAASDVLQGKKVSISQQAPQIRGFGATAPKSDKHRETVNHENQTEGAAEKAGFSKKESAMMYSGNWQRDMNQLLLPIANIISKPLFSILSIAHTKHFGFPLPSKEEFGTYDPVEHIDNPGGLTGDGVYNQSHDSAASSAKDTIGGKHDSLSDVDKRYKEEADKNADKSKLLNPNDSYAFQVDETAIPVYLRTSRNQLIKSLQTAVDPSATDPTNKSAPMDENRRLRIIGEALHTMQDYYAHSNFCEIAINILLNNKETRKALEDSGLEIGEYNLNSYVHGFNEKGKVKEKNLTHNGKEVMATGTFLLADTAHSLKEKLNGLLKELNPFEKESIGKPSEWVIAVCNWLEQNPEWFSSIDISFISTAMTEINSILSPVLGVASDVTGGAGEVIADSTSTVGGWVAGGLDKIGADGASDYVKDASKGASDSISDTAKGYQKEIQAIKSSLDAADEALAKNAKDKTLISFLYQVAYNSLSPFLRISTYVRKIPVIGEDLYKKVKKVEDDMREKARKELEEKWNEARKKIIAEYNTIIDNAVGSTEVTDTKHSTKTFTQPTHTDIAKDFHEDSASDPHDDHEEDGDHHEHTHRHGGAWLASLADYMARAASFSILQTIKPMLDDNKKSNGGDVENKVKEWYAHPADCQNTWKNKFTEVLSSKEESSLKIREIISERTGKPPSKQAPNSHQTASQIASENVSDQIPEADNQFYAHGSFMGAGIELMEDDKWNYILRKLMPDVHHDVTQALSKDKGSEKVIIMFENNPVTAAYGLARTQAKDELNENGRNDRMSKLEAFEWDAFLPPDVIEKYKNANSEAEKTRLGDQLVEGLVIAHGNTPQTIKENGPLGGLRQYDNVRKTRKSGQGGVASSAWMDIFGKAMIIGSDPNWRAKADEIGSKKRVNNKKDQTSDKTFVDKMSFSEVVKIYKDTYKKDLFSVILDVKSRDTTPEVLQGLIKALNRQGVHVYGVGSFINSELQGLRDVDQIIDGKKVADALQILFFHKAGDLQNACLNNEIAPGDTVMFNAGNLISYDRFSRGKNKKKSYQIKDEVVSQIGKYKEHYGFKLGVYVQENSIDDRAATLITDLTNSKPEIFDMGFAWGGVTGETAADIEPSLGSEKTGIGGQWIVGDEWDTDKPLPKTLTLEESKSQIRTASKGLGTDEEAIYDAIRNCPDRTALKNDSTIMALLRDEMSGHDLWKAILLLEYGIESMFPVVVQEIWKATKGLGTDEDLIYSTLQKLNKTQLEVIRKIPGLKEILKDELSGDDLEASNDLLSGDYAKAISEHQKDVQGMVALLAKMSKGTEIERNTAEWLNPKRKGGAKNKLHVCSKTHDSKERAEKHTKKKNRNAYFGANEIVPNSGTYDAHIDSTRNIRFVQENTGGHHLKEDIWMYDVRRDPNSTKTVLIHEVQHDADRHDHEEGHDKPNGSPEESWNRYKTEFRAYWVDGRYNSISKEEDKSIKDFHNARQKKIFDLLHGTSKDKSLYPWLWDTYDKDVEVNGKKFKSLVHNYSEPEGINLKNSPRIDDLYNALHEAKSSDKINSPRIVNLLEKANNLKYGEANHILNDKGAARIRKMMRKNLSNKVRKKVESVIKSKVVGDFPVPDKNKGIIV